MSVENKTKYRVRIAKNDSVTNVEYDNVIHVWHQGGVMLGLLIGERGQDREYAYWPLANIDHVHIEEQK